MPERGWVWLRRAFLPVSVALLVLAGAVVPLPAFVERPGSAAGIPACVTIEGRPDARVNGDFMFTTVAQREATMLSAIAAALVADQRVIPQRDLLGDLPRDRYFERQRELFMGSTERATVVALEAAGLPVEIRGAGVAVVDVLADSPAVGVLEPGDVITGVNGEPVRTDGDLVDAVTATTPLRLEVVRDGQSVTHLVRPHLREIDGERRPVIGVRITTHDPQVQLPLAIDVASGRVGGPSAGLMIGLAVYDLVDDVDLAAGRRIAGTGTLELDGRVGRIDSVELKVRVADGAGAEIFVAPAGQADAARSAVPRGSDLQVIGVETFDDARGALAGADPVAGADARAAPSCPFTPER